MKYRSFRNECETDEIYCNCGGGLTCDNQGQLVHFVVKLLYVGIYVVFTGHNQSPPTQCTSWSAHGAWDVPHTVLSSRKDLIV